MCIWMDECYICFSVFMFYCNNFKDNYILLLFKMLVIFLNFFGLIMIIFILNFFIFSFRLLEKVFFVYLVIEYVEVIGNI